MAAWRGLQPRRAFRGSGNGLGQGGKSKARDASFPLRAPGSGGKSTAEGTGPEPAGLRSRLCWGTCGGSGPSPASVPIPVQGESWAQESPGHPLAGTCPGSAALSAWQRGPARTPGSRTAVQGKARRGGESHFLSKSRPVTRRRETRTGRCRVRLTSIIFI